MASMMMQSPNRWWLLFFADPAWDGGFALGDPGFLITSKCYSFEDPSWFCRTQTPEFHRRMLNESQISRSSTPPPSHDFNKYNFLPHVLNLLTLIQSDADTGLVSSEVEFSLLQLIDAGRSTTISIP
jgi:hypothetical protein